ncbi:ABC transporter ATP-binding protein [Lactobacillus corticis]|uniref:Nitrate/sulfonate/bicarbonate ABC transporter ATP-binding protein n=1 Tax=Lactobacillus corticis TaxID=2201249 RepID=A0A916QHF0_9LACO|nr:ABC transporter ATP-binding protein [Lactobacillus corticis]GFZ27024.1 nitrate/sulfonate/bicarbonate ABC transporter ATP-binding protein [Lactobacillus corticis]
MALIELDGVSKKYGDKTVLKNVSLKISEGDFVALCGMSGGGKSTLLRLISGLEKADSGSIKQENKEISTINSDARMMFQDDRLLPWQTVIQNLLFGDKSEERIKLAKRLLDRVGLIDYQNSFPASLSGGQRQRVALARALMSQPKVLLLDEPLGALDALTRRNMQDLIIKVCSETNITTILVTHDVQEAVRMADKIWIIKNQGIAKELTNPERNNQTAEAQLKKDQLVETALSCILDNN